MQKRAPAGFSVPQAAQVMELSLRHHPGVAIGLGDLRQQALVHQRQVATVDLQHRTGMGRIPEGAQLAIEVVAGRTPPSCSNSSAST